MTDAEAIVLLARWVYQLRVDAYVAEHRALAAEARAAELADRNIHLETRLLGFEFWVRSGLTPREIHEAAAELDPAVVGAA